MHKTHPKVGWLLFQAKDSKEGLGMVIHACHPRTWEVETRFTVCLRL